MGIRKGMGFNRIVDPQILVNTKEPDQLGSSEHSHVNPWATVMSNVRRREYISASFRRPLLAGGALCAEVLARHLYESGQHEPCYRKALASDLRLLWQLLLPLSLV